MSPTFEQLYAPWDDLIEQEHAECEGGGSSMPMDTLFHCDHFGREFAFRHCRRRQLERKATIEKKKPTAGAPVHEFCASGVCVRGLQVAAALEAADVPSASCPRCGTAFVGPEADRPCPDCSAARAREREPMVQSTRIWTGEAPDLPIGGPPASANPPRKPITFGPPPSRRASPPRELAPAAATERAEPAEPQARELAPNEKRMARSGEEASHVMSPGKPGAPPTPIAAPVNPEVAPARPAVEETMARGGAHEPCRECGSTTRHKQGCSKPGRGGGAPARKVSPAKPVERQSGRGLGPLDGWDVEDLLAAREHIREELKRRRDESKATLSKLDAALEEAA